ncbi:MAG: SCO family protein [Burkholderiales bacterium]
MTRLLAALAVVVLGVFLSGCNSKPAPFNAVDITGITGYGNDFRLVDHNGKPRTMAEFHGKVVAIVFGFTVCPDVCPTTMSEMRSVMKSLGPQSEKLQVLFVTVDPARDTQELLAKYVPAFHPSFLGLRGDAEATAKVTRDFKIVARTVPGKTPDSYTVDHTAGTLIFDRQGRLRLMAPYGMDAEKLAADIKRLM